jgi:hypothetical protein
MHYILDENHNPVQVTDWIVWGAWYSNADRVVGLYDEGGIRISTVFLGIDHGLFFSDKPILFETMIFGGEYDGEQRRYSTWKEAELGHAALVAIVKPMIDTSKLNIEEVVKLPSDN